MYVHHDTWSDTNLHNTILHHFTCAESDTHIEDPRTHLVTDADVRCESSQRHHVDLVVAELRQERRHDRRGGGAGCTERRHGGDGGGRGGRRGGRHVDLEWFLWLGGGGGFLHLAGGRELGLQVGQAVATLQVVTRTQLLGEGR